nr:MAG TPA: hypothetical protein [Caudoviricetes sp.]
MKGTEKQIAWAKDIIARDMETVKKYVENGYKNTPYAEDPRINREEDRRIMHIAEMAGFDGNDDSAEAAIEGYAGFTTVWAMDLPKAEKKAVFKKCDELYRDYVINLVTEYLSRDDLDAATIIENRKGMSLLGLPRC